MNDLRYAIRMLGKNRGLGPNWSVRNGLRSRAPRGSSARARSRLALKPTCSAFSGRNCQTPSASFMRVTTGSWQKCRRHWPSTRPTKACRCGNSRCFGSSCAQFHVLHEHKASALLRRRAVVGLIVVYEILLELRDHQPMPRAVQRG